jgi:hypothetical protein
MGARLRVGHEADGWRGNLRVRPRPPMSPLLMRRRGYLECAMRQPGHATRGGVGLSSAPQYSPQSGYNPRSVKMAGLSTANTGRGGRLLRQHGVDEKVDLVVTKREVRAVQEFRSRWRSFDAATYGIGVGGVPVASVGRGQ